MIPQLRSETAVADVMRDGMTIGVGGSGLDRKPMSLLRVIARSSVRDLTLTAFNGALDVELLIAAGKLARVAYCHVGLDHFGLAPLFRAAREAGRLAVEEWSEWTMLAAWRAAAERIPFTPVAFDAESELLRVNPHLTVTRSPFSGQQVVAVEAQAVDLALLHAEAVHPDGWAVARGDPYADVLLARAARTVIVSAERLMDDAELEERQRDVHLLASYVDALVLAPGGSLPGSCIPEYMLDFQSLREYIETCGLDADPSRALAALLNPSHQELRVILREVRPKDPLLVSGVGVADPSQAQDDTHAGTPGKHPEANPSRGSAAEVTSRAASG